jgi:hypothetical protein
MHLLRQPRRCARQIDEAVFDRGRLGVKAHHLVALGLDRLDNAQPVVGQFLNQLSARGLVLDQYDRRAKHVRLLAHEPLQIGIVHLAPQYVEQIKPLVLDALGRAHGVVREFGRLACSVPALKFLLERFGRVASVYVLNHSL